MLRLSVLFHCQMCHSKNLIAHRYAPVLQENISTSLSENLLHPFEMFDFVESILKTEKYKKKFEASQ